MHKQEKPQHAGPANADAIADDLGISNEKERARLQDWVPQVIDAFHMHKRQKVERLTPARQDKLLSAFEKKTASFMKDLADERICSMMMLHEHAQVLGNEKLTFDEKVVLLDQADQSVLDDAQEISSRIENVLCRVRARRTELQERASLSIAPATQYAVHWLTQQCFDYWCIYLRPQKQGRERVAAGVHGQVERKARGPQLRFVAGIFALAGHPLGDEAIKTHLSEARARRRLGPKPGRVIPLSFDTKGECRREFIISMLVEDLKLSRGLAELHWDDLLTGTYGLLPEVEGEGSPQ